MFKKKSHDSIILTISTQIYLFLVRIIKWKTSSSSIYESFTGDYGYSPIRLLYCEFLNYTDYASFTFVCPEPSIVLAIELVLEKCWLCYLD